MEDVVTTILVPAIVTLVATVLAGMLLDYVRNARARITYFVTAAIPIPVSGKTIGAYLVGLANTSKQTIKDVSCHVQASPAVVRNGGIETSQGLQYTVTERGDGIDVVVPYLSSGDQLELTIVAEGVTMVPPIPDVAIRTPHRVAIVKTTREIANRRSRAYFLLPGAVAAAVVGIVGGILLGTGSSFISN